MIYKKTLLILSEVVRFHLFFQRMCIYRKFQDMAILYIPWECRGHKCCMSSPINVSDHDRKNVCT